MPSLNPICGACDKLLGLSMLAIAPLQYPMSFAHLIRSFAPFSLSCPLLSLGSRRAVDEALERLLSQNVKLNEQSGLIFDDFYVQLVKVRFQFWLAPTLASSSSFRACFSYHGHLHVRKSVSSYIFF